VDDAIPLGTKRVIDGRARVFYYGYWIRAYDAPADTLQAKKQLIEALTRRLFNHVEHGINVPGNRLREARRAYELELDPARKRVKGGMLAGALFNRAADVFRKVVEMQALGVEIEPDNALMSECGKHLEDALELSKLVLHRSGEEGLDELWGEPFKAFAFPIQEFYKSRYVKIAQTMAAIDRIGEALTETFRDSPPFAGLEPLIATFVKAAKANAETLRTDDDIFDIWTSLVVSGEALSAFSPAGALGASPPLSPYISVGHRLIREAKDVILHIARARVPMPKTAGELIQRFQAYKASATNHAPLAMPMTLGAASSA
jgi:hypothetical protein